MQRASGTLIRASFIVLLIIFWGLVGAGAQEIRTAESFFAEVSESFGMIDDYSCDFVISQGSSVSTGKLYYKRPDLLRLDFEQPEEQVVLSDGEKLQVYLPTTGVILLQEFSRRGDSAPAGAMNLRGLYLLSDGYDIAYLDSPEPVALNSPEDLGDGGGESEEEQPSAPLLTDEMVVKLRLTRSSSLELFREIILSIGEDMMIRRFRGIADDYAETVTDFRNVIVNEGIPDNRFEEEAWPEANVYPDFLIETE